LSPFARVIAYISSWEQFKKISQFVSKTRLQNLSFYTYLVIIFDKRGSVTVPHYVSVNSCAALLSLMPAVISSTLNVRIFRTNARIMLMKLTKAVNFINILLKPFLYKSVLRSFSLITFWHWNFLVEEYWCKSCL